jgi:hypothetical protein
MYNIIILIIATNEPKYYELMSDIWKKYMNNHPQIKTYFIKDKLKEQNEEIYIDEQNFTIHTNIKDSLIPGILIKTIKSIEYINNNFNFKYIYRTNLSSFLNLQLMNDYILNNNFDYGAVIGKCNNISYGSGCGFFLSKKICDYLIKNKNLLEYNLYDDVAIGKLLTKKVDIFSIPRIDIVDINNEKNKINNNIFHYRCKHTCDMYKTVDNLNFLYKIYYENNT